MKPSNYNFISKDNEEISKLINSRSGAILNIPTEHVEHVKLLLNSPDLQQDDFTKMLKENGFVIDDDVNEIKQLSNIFEAARNGKKALGIGIVTTLDCNFRCTYCFEEHNNIKMSDELCSSIVKYVQSNCSDRDVINVNWFGGEPLLCPDIISKIGDELVKICNKNNIILKGQITTNGYLLNKKNVDLLLKYGVNSIQITLDGPPYIHDKRRFLRSGEGTFSKILDNIKSFASSFEDVCIRINIDTENKDSMPDLLDILEPLKDIIILAFRPTMPISERDNGCVTNAEFTELEKELMDIACSRGFKMGHGYAIPGTPFCSAYQKNAFMVDPYGDIHLCPVYVGRREFRYAKLLEGGIISEIGGLQHSFLNFNPCKDEKCIKCEVLPICMGGCLWHLTDEGSSENRCMHKFNFLNKFESDAALNRTLR